MKYLTINLAMIFFVMACSTPEVKVVKPVEEKPVSIIALPLNLDLKFNEDLNRVWSNYFTEDFSDSKAMTIFVVTNRNLKQGNLVGCSDDFFGVTTAPSVKTFACKVNIPKNHTTGEIKNATDNRLSSHDYFKILNAKSLDQAGLIENLKKSQRVPLVFVHGFNVKFQEAIYRASQIAYDLKYQGPVVLFSWPAGSEDGFLNSKLLNKTYKNNSLSATESVVAFKGFLSSIANAGLKINLFVHSMGHQVVLPALNQLSIDSHGLGDKKLINELILNAPDFEVDKFSEAVENLKSITKRITLYCSFNDNAMIASEAFNQNKRLGACALLENLDTINVGLVDAPTMGIGGLGHGYYSSRPILSDIFQVLLGIDAEKRLFIRKSEPNSTEKYYLRP